MSSSAAVSEQKKQPNKSSNPQKSSILRSGRRFNPLVSCEYDRLRRLTSCKIDCFSVSENIYWPPRVSDEFITQRWRHT